MFKAYLIVLLFSISSFTVIAKDNNSFNRKAETVYAKLFPQMAATAKTIGISISIYKHSLDQFMRLADGVAQPDMQKIANLPEYSDPSAFSKQHLLSVVNGQKSKFASFLGLPVEKLRTFLNLSSHLYLEQESFNKNNSSLTGSHKMEHIVITCKDACYPQPTITMNFEVLISSLVVNNGNINPYEKFMVDYQDSSNNIVNREIWKSNNFSGAWRVKVVAKPCPTCSFN